MKLLLIFGGVLAVVSCSPISVVDQVGLGRAEMSFDQKGADLTDCGLTGLIERGRALSGQNSGGGCASCH